MTSRTPNPLGPPVGGNTAQRPSRETRLVGRHVTLVGVSSAQHADQLYPHISGPENAYLWDYLFDGPFDDIAVFRANLKAKETSQDPVFYSILLNDQGNNEVVGMTSYLRIEPGHRCIEVGSLLFLPKLQRTPAATEAMYLMARHVFEDLGYRRYEWKCNELNAPSRRAALRLGFTYDGLFRKHMIVRGLNRDTTWFSMIDDDWPGIKQALEAWLDPSNFDGEGKQKKRLEEFRQ
ncbi:putative acetyltransferase, GNAT family [Annulohypoxylon maeteangense]|uniref:putative acetyltransferase, GNAT family n=1 Tax=Annulohypoxylon maeteangense TaxID=1927788 RepID=UPI002007A085|nr:putative acetyltransferase, GNAT family [Annulohypoxylon maeteangense]KAI0885710.1 putative acetyltransferase, GNAT family [Annulohypoxylon maeteangense]